MVGVVESGGCTSTASSIGDSSVRNGQVVFCFSPHGTHSFCSPSEVIPVPEGISIEDAVFAPSVETAISLVHGSYS